MSHLHSPHQGLFAISKMLHCVSALIADLIITFGANLLLGLLLCGHHTKPVPVGRLKPQKPAESLETEF